MKEKIDNILSDLRKSSIEEIASLDVKDVWLENLISLRNLENTIYNLKDKEINAYEKMLLYKKYNTKILEVDCDVSLRSMVIYALAFDYVLEKDRKLIEQPSYNKNKQKYYFSNGKDFIYSGDTMNSFKQITDCYFSFCYDDSNKKEKDYSYIRKFVTLNHTVGNFIPIPYQVYKKISLSLNVARNASLKDYWDLVLKNIYDWYTKKEEQYLLNIIGNQKSKIKEEKFMEMLKEWLSKFESWENFVDKNYLWSFVNKKDENKPEEFWKEHFSSSILPTKIGQCECFFETVSKSIEQRGKDIAHRIKDVLENYPNNEEILKKFFSGIE